MKKTYLMFFCVALILLLPSSGAQGNLLNYELVFDTELTLETPLINLGLAKFIIVGEIDISPNFEISSYQNQKNIDSSDTINLSLDSKGFTGHITITALGEQGNIIGSQSVAFHFDQSPLGDVVLPLPEVGIQIIIGLLTISPRLIITSSLNSEIRVEGPATSSPNSLIWNAEGEKSIHVSFQSNTEHVTVSLQNINYDLGVYLELGFKVLSIELTAIHTPSVSQTITSSLVDISVAEYNAMPVARFTFEPLNPTEKDTVSFTDTSTDDDGNIVGCLWEFGDGTTDTSRNPSRKFLVGTYSIRLTATDNDGAEGSLSKTITISKAAEESQQKGGILGFPPEVFIIVVVLVIIAISIIYIRKNKK